MQILTFCRTSGTETVRQAQSSEAVNPPETGVALDSVKVVDQQTPWPTHRLRSFLCSPVAQVPQGR
jgi:hypothetical protein